MGYYELLIILGFIVTVGVVALVVVLVLRASAAKCVHCLKRIPKGARVCHHCQRDQATGERAGPGGVPGP